jgi:aryl-alcohol dehydrogenase-like predicted oxidoreductase
MRLSTDPDAANDEERATATIRAAADAGITVFDTARAYAPDASRLGHNERMLARAIGGGRGARAPVRVVTKGGMTRAGGAWVPDGRAKSIAADCEASLEALGGLSIDVYLLHAPDPRTPFETSVRALARLAAAGLVARVGLSNVNRRQLEQACDLAPIAAVQVSLSVLDDRALRGGVVELCAERGIVVMAHSPLGGPRRARGLARRTELSEVADRNGATAAEVALAWLLELPADVVAIAGARRPETATSAARAGSLAFDDDDRRRLMKAFGGGAPRVRPTASAALENGEVVLVMGIPGAGKSRIAAGYVDRGYVRLNRDELGGTLRDIAAALEERLSAGERRIVLDNTYPARADRTYPLEAAALHGLPVRCVWLDTPLDQAQVNMVERLLDRFGSLPSPEQLRAVARREQGLMLPTSQMRALRELEPPSEDEGFAKVERVPFVRAPAAGPALSGVLVAAAVLGEGRAERALEEVEPESPHLVFDWRPEGSADELAEVAAAVSRRVTGPVESAICPHGGGPPSCWCRPPLPGLALAFARRHGIDPARLSLIGSSAAHRTLARTLGARYVEV